MKNSFILIPKVEVYVEYVINILNSLPRVEKFNIGNNFKDIVYEMVYNVVILSKVGNSYRLQYSNLIDAGILTQRIYIRLMYKKRYIDLKKYNHSILLLDEIGKILGGYIKSIGTKYEKV